jgi:2-oxoisovalerate dehydrogenase E1 component
VVRVATVRARATTVQSLDTDPVDQHFRDRVAELATTPVPAGPVDRLDADTARELLELFDAAAGSRHLDLVARELRARDEAFYTIGSAGHEANAAVAAALRPTDPALLHYRSGGFYLRRAGQVAGHDGIRDVLLGLVAAAAEPIAGGRHKVFGHADLAVIPQTSTIASHLPRAVGVALTVERSRKLGVASPWPSDAITVCSFGDASVNHSTAAGAINTACHIAFQGLPLPLLLVCEDNRLGISVPTPAGWVRAAYQVRPGLRYLAADGSDVLDVLAVAREAVAYVRDRRRPAFLHLTTVRLMGHAGSDAEAGYRSSTAIAADLARDPLVHAAKRLVQAGVLDPAGLLARYDAVRARVDATAAEVVRLPKLADAPTIMAPIAPRRPAAVADRAAVAADHHRRLGIFGGRLPEDEGPLTLAQSINRALHDVLAATPGALVFGQDVAAKGGVYGVTRGLQRRFGAGRVFDTLLDEQAVLGLALGAGVSGLLPIAEIQYLAYLHNAEDQIRGEAATLQFFSQGRYRNPMVVRVPAYGYQRGFGGHFHNDSSVAVLRDVPGLIIASPSGPADAPAMLRTCVAAALVDGSVCVFLEPIARYHERDLSTPGDGACCAPYDAPARWVERHVPVGRARTWGDGGDLALVTFGNGVPMALSVAARLAADGIAARVVDLRWLAPLPLDDLLDAAHATGRVLVVDETRRTGGVAEGVMAALLDAGFRGPLARVAAEDSFVPLGAAALHVLVAADRVELAARELADRRRTHGD